VNLLKRLLEHQLTSISLAVNDYCYLSLVFHVALKILCVAAKAFIERVFMYARVVRG